MIPDQARQILRSPRLLVYFALQALAATAFVFLEPPENTRFWDGVFDVGHCLLFVFLTWTILRIIETVRPERSSRLRSNIGALAAILLLAGASELLQRFQPTRDPSVGDFIRDAAGTVAAFLIYPRPVSETKRASSRRTLLTRGIAVTLFLMVLAQFALVVDIYVERDRAFPTLLRFDGSRWQRRLVRVFGGQLGRLGASPLTVEGASPCAPLVLNPGRVPALTLDEPYPDWTGYKRLAFSVASTTDEPVKLRIRVNDSDYRGGDDDSFNRDIEIGRGELQIRIPLDDIRDGPTRRYLDLRRVRTVTFFVWRPRQTVVLCLGQLRLE